MKEITIVVKNKLAHPLLINDGFKQHGLWYGIPQYILPESWTMTDNGEYQTLYDYEYKERYILTSTNIIYPKVDYIFSDKEYIQNDLEEIGFIQIRPDYYQLPKDWVITYSDDVKIVLDKQSRIRVVIDYLNNIDIKTRYSVSIVEYTKKGKMVVQAYDNKLERVIYNSDIHPLTKDEKVRNRFLLEGVYWLDNYRLDWLNPSAYWGED